MQRKVYTINRDATSVMVRNDRQSFLLGGYNPRLMRHLQYDLHPRPRFVACRGPAKTIASRLVHADHPIECDTALYPDSRLYVPKHDGPCMRAPMNDGGFHQHAMAESEFLLLPFTRCIGIVILISILEENSKRFVFDCLILDPSEYPEMQKRHLPSWEPR